MNRLPRQLIERIIEFALPAHDATEVGDYGNRGIFWGHEFKQMDRMCKAVSVLRSVSPEWSQAVSYVIRRNKKIYLWLRLGDVWLDKKGCFYLGNDSYLHLEPWHYDKCASEIAFLMTLPVSLSVDHFQICCRGCNVWLPELVSEMKKLKQQGLSINCKKFRISDCGDDHGWQDVCYWGDVRFKEIKDNILQLNDLIKEMSKGKTYLDMGDGIICITCNDADTYRPFYDDGSCYYCKVDLQPSRKCSLCAPKICECGCSNYPYGPPCEGFICDSCYKIHRCRACDVWVSPTCDQIEQHNHFNPKDY